MKHVIIGTAGHVDHGKTSLIQALTGTNTDRLKEEQERGMTIDLGFAVIKLPDGTIAGIVDVPGHERFLKNMLAGASGVDLVLLVIAADEGVMPQTIEHLNVLRLLDVNNGVVALTKMDTVDKEWTDIVEEDVRTRLKETFLAQSPIIRVSSTTGKGIEALKKALMAAVSRSDVRNPDLPFRLPIDRVFTRPGFGTVVTGTLVSGTMRVGDAVQLLPAGLPTRIRGIQIHGVKVPVAEAGTRVALNLAGVDTAEIERGAQVTFPGSLSPTLAFDASLRLLPESQKLLEDRERVRLHIGTSEVLGRVRILDSRAELGPDEKAFIQFQGEEQICCLRGDRFILRSYSPMFLLGGGTVLDPHPPRHKKADEAVQIALQAREKGSPADLVETALQRYTVGISQPELPTVTGLSIADCGLAIEQLISAGTLVRLPQDRLILSAVEAQLQQRALGTLDSFHGQFPLRPGLPREELRAALGKQVDSKAFGALMAHWHQLGQLSSEGAIVRRKEFRVELSDKQNHLLSRIEEIYKIFGIATPTVEEVAREAHTSQEAVVALLRVGQERGSFLRVEDGVFYHRETLEHLKSLAATFIGAHSKISVGEFRDLTESNRKYALQALEYFDKIRFTRRIGDIRTLYASDTTETHLQTTPL